MGQRRLQPLQVAELPHSRGMGGPWVRRLSPSGWARLVMTCLCGAGRGLQGGTPFTFNPAASLFLHLSVLDLKRLLRS